MKNVQPHSLHSNYKYLQVWVPNDYPSVVVVCLNRPKKRNAICSEMWVEIGHVFSNLGRLGDGCRAVVLTGNGTSFSAGIDISDASFFPNNNNNKNNDDNETNNNNNNNDISHVGITFRSKILQMQQCFTAVEQCPVPVIAAVHGNCIGAGVDLICACDIRLCTASTIFSVREVQIGLAADIGTLQRLPKVTGNDSKVRELCFTGENFNADTALSIGFISRIIVSVELLYHDAIQLALKITTNSPVAVYGTKQSLNYSRNHTIAEGLEHIANHNSLALLTKDTEIAFLAKLNKEETTPKFPNFPAFSKL